MYCYIDHTYCQGISIWSQVTEGSASAQTLSGSIWALGRERKKGKSPEQFEETTPKEENPV